MTISGGRTKQLDIFCHVTGFTSDFLGFIDVELIRLQKNKSQIMLLRETVNSVIVYFSHKLGLISFKTSLWF